MDQMTTTKDTAFTGWLEGWREPDRRPLPEWSATISLKGDYATKGPVSFDHTRHLIKPAVALTDDRIQIVNARKAIQTFGSGLGDLFTLYNLRNRPGPSMITMQTDDDAMDHFATRIGPTMEADEHLAKQYAAMKKRRGLLVFPSSSLYLQGPNWNSLQRKSIRWEWNDEIWRWPVGMLKEAYARTEAFKGRRKIYNSSQAGVVDDDEDLNFRSGTMYNWGYRCPCCQHTQRLEFAAKMLDDTEARAGIIWNDDARRVDGRWDFARVATTVRLRCVRCGNELPDTQSSWAICNASGDYILEQEGPPDNLSFRWNSLVAGYWSDLAIEFLTALEQKRSGMIEAFRQFHQKKLVNPYSEAFEESRIELKTGEFAMGERLPADEVAFTFILADYQEGRGSDTEHFWVLAAQVRADGSDRLVHYGRMESEEQIRAMQLDLGAPDRCVALDGGHKFLDIAARAARFGWLVLRGEDRELYPHHIEVKDKKTGRLMRRLVMRAFSERKKVDPHRGTAKAGKEFAWFINWSNPTIKDFVARLRRGEGPKRELPVDLPETYRSQIDSELPVVVTSNHGASRRTVWRPISANNPNNHAWDCECMRAVLAMIAGVLSLRVEKGEQHRGEH
jgi:hypothetical protein